jgi:hypothetical protein
MVRRLDWSRVEARRKLARNSLGGAAEPLGETPDLGYAVHLDGWDAVASAKRIAKATVKRKIANAHRDMLAAKREEVERRWLESLAAKPKSKLTHAERNALWMSKMNARPDRK